MTSRPSTRRGALLAGALLSLATAGPAAAQAPSGETYRDVRANERQALREDDQGRSFARQLETEDELEIDEFGRVRGSATVEFDDELYLDNDLMLQGITAFETLVFTRPQPWNLTRDPVVELHFEHSAALAPNRSSLTVWVNGSAVASSRLDATNLTEGLLRARIPRHVLQDYNELKIGVVQHIDDECEDPFDPALWTRVSNQSSITFDYWHDPVGGELGDLPYPIFDKLGYGPLRVAVAGPSNVSKAQLDALSQVSFALGRIAAYRRVRFEKPVNNPVMADSHVLVVGTPQDNPLVGRLISQTPGAGEGLVAIVPKPGNPTKAALVVTGGDAAGLNKAMEAVTSKDRTEVLAGPITRIDSVRDGDPPPTRRSPLPAPAKNDFTLAELGIDDVTVRGYYAPPISIPVQLEGDAKVQIEGAEVAIDYAYSAYLDTRLSTMEVRLNGVTLRSVGLDDPDGEEKRRLKVDLPFELLEPDSELEVVFHLFPIDFGPCVYITDKHIWGSVFASTEFDVARDHYAMLPDLQLLRHDLWPYGAALGDEGLVIATANQPTLDDATAAGQLTAELGRRSVAPSPEYKVVPAASGIAERVPNAQLILLVGDSPHALYDELANAQRVSLPGELDRRLQKEGDNDLMNAAVTSPYGTVEQSLFQGTERTALTLRSPRDKDLTRLVRVLQDDGKLRALKGNVSVIAETGESVDQVRSLSVSDQKQVGKISLRSQIQTALRGSWWMLGIAVLLAAAFLALLVRAWAARRGGQA